MASDDVIAILNVTLQRLVTTVDRLADVVERALEGETREEEAQ